MQKSQLTRKGITFVEVLIVMCILVTLFGILWMVLAPKAMRSARATAITGGLKQAASGLAIYRGDNNDSYPADWREFGFTKPNSEEYIKRGGIRLTNAPPSYPESWRTEQGRGATELTYLYNSGVQHIVERLTMRYPFEEQTYPIFAANFFPKLIEEHGHPWTFAPPKMRIYRGNGETYPVYARLGAFTDGHVKWGPHTDIWEMEYDYRLNFGEK